MFDYTGIHYRGMLETDGSVNQQEDGMFIIYEIALPAGTYHSNMPTQGVTKMSCKLPNNDYDVITPNKINDWDETFIVPSNAIMVYFSFWSGRDSDIESIDYAIFKKGMIVLGDKLPDEYIEFYNKINKKYKIDENNCLPGTDLTSFIKISIIIKELTNELTTNGFNCLNVGEYKRGLIDTDGMFVEREDDTANYIFYVSVQSGEKYAINAVPLGIHAYRSSGDYYGLIAPLKKDDTKDYAIFSVPEDVERIAISMWYGRWNDINPSITQISNIVMRKGEKATQKRVGIPWANVLKNLKINNYNFDYIEFNQRIKNGVYWCILGDSRSVDLAYTNKFYHDYITERHPVFNKTNLAVSGARISNYNSNLSIIDQLKSIPKDTDLITLYAGINDYGQDNPTPLGTFEESDTTQTTFYGAMNYIVKYIISNYPKTKIIFLTPIPQYNFQISGSIIWGDRNYTNSLDLSLDDYINAMKKVCEWYGVKCCDMCHEVGITPRIPEQRSLYFTDGLHHNEYGQEEISYYIEHKIMGTL